MGKDIDWKETEWLVTQLRARLAEDQANEGEDKKPVEPAQRPAPRYDTVKKKKKRNRPESSVPRDEEPIQITIDGQLETPVVEESAPAVKESTPVAEVSAPAVEESVLAEEEPIQITIDEQAELLAAEVPTLATEEVAPVAEEVAPLAEEVAPVAEDLGVFEEELPTEPVEETPPAQEQAEPAVVAEPMEPYRRALPPQKRTALFAAARERDLMPEYRENVPASTKSPRKKAVAPQVRTDREMQAEVTVENLMQDLFGAGSLGWFGGKETVEKPLETAPAPVQEQPEVKIAPPKPTAPPAKEEAVSESAFVQRLEQKKRAKEQKVDTLTREIDGQMTLVLPETGKPLVVPSGEQEHRARREERGSRQKDDGQIDLFTADDLSKALEPDEKEEKSEFKRSIEASDEDFQLLLGLDYEDELGSAIGFEKIRAYHEEGVNGQPVTRSRRRNAGRREYEVQGQDTTLRKNYTKQKREHVLRLGLSVFFTLLIMIYEKAGWMAALFGGFLDGKQYPATYVLIGIQLLVIAAFFSYQRLWEGFLRILKFSPIDYSLCSVTLIATVIYHIVLIFLPHTGAPALYLSPAAMSLVLLALADLLDWYRESLAFQVVSSRKQKYALIPRVSVGGRQGNARYSLIDDESAGTVWYVRPVGFVRNYFANTEKRIGHGRTQGMRLLLILAMGVAFGIYALAAGGTAVDMVRTVFVTFLLCVPVTSLLVTSLPMFLAACLRLGKNGAIIGEEPVYRCGGTTTLVVPDSEVFGAMHHEQFEALDEEYYDHASVLVRALLEKMQSPLRDSLNVERDRRIPPSEVTLTDIEEEGVRATVGDAENVMLMGSVEYLQSHGIEVPERVSADAEYGGKRLICIAAGGEMIAFFLARYRLNDDMSTLLRELEGESVNIMVRTKDPGIRDDLFETLLPDRGEPVRVMKPTAREMDLRTDRVDATVVALGSCREASRTFVTCRRVRRAANFGKIFQGLSMVAGSILAAALTFLGGSVGVSSFLVSVYFLFWCAAHAATSYFFLRERGDE